MNYILMLLPAGLITLSQYLRSRDANSTGADDTFANIAMEMSFVAPELVQGRATDTNLDRALRAINRVTGAYIAERDAQKGTT